MARDGPKVVANCWSHQRGQRQATSWGLGVTGQGGPTNSAVEAPVVVTVDEFPCGRAAHALAQRAIAAWRSSRIRIVYTRPISVPVTTRLSEAAVASLEAAVAAGYAPDRASAVAAAVEEWLGRRDRERIAASYRRRYAEPDAELEAINRDVGAIATWPED